ncbi:hypothetical protein CANDROIZ_330015 [Candidatus Roizmanbacteria bacterium]|nr:hypothetical protein CANDROIZ_330015 [Candidatus Roizmanbacteria bacterium]
MYHKKIFFIIYNTDLIDLIGLSKVIIVILIAIMQMN